jgi:hypothetical protein
VKRPRIGTAALAASAAVALAGTLAPPSLGARRASVPPRASGPAHPALGLSRPGARGAAGTARGRPAQARGERAGAGAPPASGGGAAPTASTPAPSAALGADPAEGDFLRENGLGSPFCANAEELGSTLRASCESSGFAAAPAPTGDYAFDVHIDTGVFDWSNDLDASFQDGLEWTWMALVVLVRGLIVMLEWCYSLDLLSGMLLGPVRGALGTAAAELTVPGLIVVLAIAACLVAWHGLVRRRVAQTLGEVAVMLAMMVAGLAVIANPQGTVGAAGRWVDEASLGSLGAIAAGTPSQPARTLAGDLQSVFGQVVTGPWCYMEFANVHWCLDPRLLDPRLRRAALRIAAQDRALAGRAGATPAEREALGQMAARVEGARTNGALFLALPANGPARNSISERGSLLSVLCGGSSDVTHCSGPTAAQAEVRTQYGTTRRFLGLVLIWLGALSMVALFGWVGVQLLRAAILTLLYLLLAPAAVLAPALGEGGRSAFRAWSARLLGALVAKLVYSLMLGVVLLMANALATVAALGWWVQWVLISVLWWIVLHHRHELLALARFGDHPAAAGVPRALGPEGDRPGLLRRARRHAEGRLTGMAVDHVVERARRRLAPAPLRPERLRQLEHESRRRTGRIADTQVAAALGRELDEARAHVARAPAIREQISTRRSQLQRIERAREAAHAEHESHDDRTSPTAAASRRRALRLHARAERVEAEIAREEGALTAARATVTDGGIASGREGGDLPDALLGERSRFYDAQARLPARGRTDSRGRRRDYRRLAGLAQTGGRGWDELSAAERRRAMLSIDSELARRAALERVGREAVADLEPAPGRRDRRRLERSIEAALERETPRSARRAGRPQAPRSTAFDAFLEEGRRQRASGAPPPSLESRAQAEAAAAGGHRAGAPRAPERTARLRRQLGRSRPGSGG